LPIQSFLKKVLYNAITKIISGNTFFEILSVEPLMMSPGIYILEHNTLISDMLSHIARGESSMKNQMLMKVLPSPLNITTTAGRRRLMRQFLARIKIIRLTKVAK